MHLKESVRDGLGGLSFKRKFTGGPQNMAVNRNIRFLTVTYVSHARTSALLFFYECYLCAGVLLISFLLLMPDLA